MEQNKTNKERGLGQGRGFFPTNLCLDWKKVMGMAGLGVRGRAGHLYQVLSTGQQEREV